MMAICQKNLVSGPITSTCNSGDNKKAKASSLQRSSFETHNLKKVVNNGASRDTIMKNSFLAFNHEKLFVSPVISCRKRVFVNSQSRSDCYTGPYNSDERSIQSNGHPFGATKEDTVRLVEHPIRVQQHGSVGRELTALAVPAIAAQALDPLAQLMETAYVGRLGPVDLASAGVSVSIFNIISKLFNIPLLSITTSFVAEDISKMQSGQETSVEAIQEHNFKGEEVSNKMAEKLKLPSVSTALLLAAVIGAIEAFALFFGAGFLLNIMGVPSASPMRSPSQKFLSLRALGAPAVVVSLAIQGVFRGFKDTKTPLFCVGVGNLSSVVLLPLLAYSFRLGITGAAIATVASQYITMFLLIWCLNKSVVIFPPKIEDLQFGGYIRSGGLLLGRTLSVLITMTLGTSMAARLGPLAMAAHQICLQVWLAVSLLSDALALSSQALIASSFAKHEYKRVKEITYFVLKTGLIGGVALAIVLFVSFSNLAELFSKDVEVLQIVKTGVLFVSATQPINALAFIFDGLHYGVSDFSYAACAMMVVGAISSIFLLYAPPIFGLAGVWSGLTLFMTLRMTAGFLRLYWKNGPWWFMQHGAHVSELYHTSASNLTVEADQDHRLEMENAISTE